MTRGTLSGGKRRRRRRALVLEPAARVPKCARASGGSGVWVSGQRACVGVLGRFSLGPLTSNSSEIAGPYTCGGVSGRQLRAFVRLRLPPPLSREQGWLLHWPSAARRWAAFFKLYGTFYEYTAHQSHACISGAPRSGEPF